MSCLTVVPPIPASSRCRVAATSLTRTQYETCATNAPFCQGNANTSVVPGFFVSGGTACDQCSGLGVCINRVCECTRSGFDQDGNVYRFVEGAATTGIYAGIEMLSGADCSTFLNIWSISSGLQSSLYFAAALAIAVCLVVAFLLIKYREKPIIRATSPFFGVIMCFGGIIAAAGVVMDALGPSGPKCNASLWLHMMGYALVFAPLYVKTHRIHYIFNAKGLKRRNKYTDYKVLQVICALLFIEVVAMILFHVLSPLELAPVVAGGDVALLCRTNESAFTAILICFNILLSLWGIFLAVQTRNVDSNYSESKLIGASIYNCFFACIVILVVMFFVVDSAPNAAYGLKGWLVCYVVIATLCLIFVPRFRMLSQGIEQSMATANTQATAGGDRGLALSLMQQVAERDGSIKERDNVITLLTDKIKALNGDVPSYTLSSVTPVNWSQAGMRPSMISQAPLTVASNGNSRRTTGGAGQFSMNMNSPPVITDNTTATAGGGATPGPGAGTITTTSNGSGGAAGSTPSMRMPRKSIFETQKRPMFGAAGRSSVSPAVTRMSNGDSGGIELSTLREVTSPTSSELASSPAGSASGAGAGAAASVGAPASSAGASAAGAGATARPAGVPQSAPGPSVIGPSSSGSGSGSGAAASGSGAVPPGSSGSGSGAGAGRGRSGSGSGGGGSGSGAAGLGLGAGVAASGLTGLPLGSMQPFPALRLSGAGSIYNSQSETRGAVPAALHKPRGAGVSTSLSTSTFASASVAVASSSSSSAAGAAPAVPGEVVMFQNPIGAKGSLLQANAPAAAAAGGGAAPAPAPAPVAAPLSRGHTPVPPPAKAASPTAAGAADAAAAPAPVAAPARRPSPAPAPAAAAAAASAPVVEDAPASAFADVGRPAAGSVPMPPPPLEELDEERAARLARKQPDAPLPLPK